MFITTAVLFIFLTTNQRSVLCCGDQSEINVALCQPIRRNIYLKTRVDSLAGTAVVESIAVSLVVLRSQSIQLTLKQFGLLKQIIHLLEKYCIKNYFIVKCFFTFSGFLDLGGSDQDGVISRSLSWWPSSL